MPNAQCLLLDILDGRVVGGEKARIAEFPHQISLRYNKKHTCGGSIIDAYYILTAAHCVYGRYSIRYINCGDKKILIYIF